MWGITEAVARKNGYTGDMRNLPIEKAKEIYRKDYWELVSADKLPYPLSGLVFDAAVNQGVDAARKMLQRAARTTQDGILGPNTLRAISAMEQTELCADFMAARGLRYIGTRNFDKYGYGWFGRLFEVTMKL